MPILHGIAGVESITHSLADKYKQAQHERDHEKARKAEPGRLQIVRALLKKFADLGGMMLGNSPAEFGKFVAAETDK